MLRNLAEHVQTNHDRGMQWDGFITTPSLFSSEFLGQDCIGAPWYRGGSAGNVGNGGFSRRSLKLLKALHLLASDPSEPEDMAIRVTLIPRLESDFGIRFAPLDAAQLFACEGGPCRAPSAFTAGTTLRLP